jgi:catechol 2,3-dioxygenase-like lactoylglutathione lyase family enzyme
MTERITGIPAVGIPVTDQDRALRFYIDALGMEKRLDVPLGQLGGRWITVAPRGSATCIALIPAHEGLTAGVETGIRLGTADAAALHTTLKCDGVDVDDLLRWEGVPPMFAFSDPDGNRLEITEATAG